jgi:hypothetical protein
LGAGSAVRAVILWSVAGTADANQQHPGEALGSAEAKENNGLSHLRELFFPLPCDKLMTWIVVKLRRAAG